MDNSELIAEARRHPEAGNALRAVNLLNSLADALERSEQEVRKLRGENERSHALLDEIFQHPIDKNEPLDRKVGRFLTDAVTVLRERDMLARGFEAAMRNQATAVKQSLYVTKDWAAIQEALALVENETTSPARKDWLSRLGQER